MYADSAYKSEESDILLEGKSIINEIHERAYGNKLLTEAQEAKNIVKSIVRAQIEHVFGFMEQSMHGLMLRSVGMARAKGSY